MRAKYMSSFGAIFISVQKLAIFTWKQQRFFLDRTFVISFPLFQHLWKGKNNCGNSSTNSCWPTIFEARLRIWQIQFQNYISCQCSDPNFELWTQLWTQKHQLKWHQVWWNRETKKRKSFFVHWDFSDCCPLRSDLYPAAWREPERGGVQDDDDDEEGEEEEVRKRRGKLKMTERWRMKIEEEFPK